MREPLIVERRDLLQVWQIAQRQEVLQSFVILLPGCGGFFMCLRARKILAATGIRCDVEPNPVEPRSVKDAARIEKIAGRGESHRGDHGFEMRWILYSRKPLDGAGIREAERADVSVGPCLARGPLDGVVAVVAFVLVWGKISI